ncbi:unnamed protein product, partial [Musa acuminata subsp. burmannicoides]
SAFCESKCKVRCAKAGVMDRCLRYCGVCFEECKCVPSGTYGNKDECPCYRDDLNEVFFFSSGGGVVMRATISNSIESLLPRRALYVHSLSRV